MQLQTIFFMMLQNMLHTVITHCLWWYKPFITTKCAQYIKQYFNTDKTELINVNHSKRNMSNIMFIGNIMGFLF